MFRLKISLTHVILVCVLIGAVHVLVNGRIKSNVDQNAEVSLRRAAVIAEQTKRVDHFALQQKGEMVAEDIDTYAYLTLEREKLLDKINNAGVDLLGGDVSKKLGGDTGKEVEKGEGKGENLSTADLRHLAVHFRLLVAKNRFKAVKQNLPEGARDIQLGLLERQPVTPDMVMIVNKDGKAVAALGRDRYSWGSSTDSPNIASNHPVIQKVIDEGQRGPVLDVWKWSWSSGDDQSLYQVAVVPVQPSKAKSPSGAVIVGYAIDDGAAKKIQNLVGGVSEKTQQQVEHLTSKDLPDVAFFHGKRIQSSTFESNDQKKLSKKFFDELQILKEDNPEELVEFKLDKTPYIAFIRFFPGQFGTDEPAGVAVLSNMEEARAPVAAVVKKFDIVAFGAILLGVALLLFFYQRFIKPAASIEETIGDILSGNKDAEFVISNDHEIFSSLVQGLNLMSAYLQGKPMPDEEAELEGWGDLVGGPGGGGGSGGSGGGSPDVQGVQMPGMGGGGSDDDQGGGS